MQMQDIKGKTPDVVLDALNKEELLAMFLEAKAQANVADAARDRLRKYIQERMDPGRHGRFILDITEGASRKYANSNGLYYLENGVIIQPDEHGTVTVRDADQKIIVRGNVVRNDECYTTGGSLKIDIVEVPQ